MPLRNHNDCHTSHVQNTKVRKNKNWSLLGGGGSWVYSMLSQSAPSTRQRSFLASDEFYFSSPKAPPL